jgi:hypothetical protein
MINKNQKSITIFLLFCLLGIIFQTKNDFGAVTVWDNFYLQFYGVSKSGFSLYTYMFFCIVYLGYPFIFQNHFFNLINGEIYYLLVRYKSLNSWFKKILLRTILNSFLIILILFVFTLVISVAMDLEMKNSVTLRENIKPSVLIYHFAINGFLQIINYILILFILVCVTKKIEYVLLSSGVLLILGLPILNIYTIFPVALNSLGYISNDSSTVFVKTFILVFYIFLELKVISYLLNKRIFIS